MSFDISNLARMFGNRLTPDMQKKLTASLQGQTDPKKVEEIVKRYVQDLPNGVIGRDSDKLNAYWYEHGRITRQDSTAVLAFNKMVKSLKAVTGDGVNVPNFANEVLPTYRQLPLDAQKQFLALSNDPATQTVLKNAAAIDNDSTKVFTAQLKAITKEESDRMATAKQDYQNGVQQLNELLRKKPPPLSSTEYQKRLKALEETYKNTLTAIRTDIAAKRAAAEANKTRCVVDALNVLQNAANAMQANPKQASDIKEIALSAFNVIGDLSSTKGTKNALMATVASFGDMAKNLPSVATFALASYKANLGYLFSTHFTGNESADDLTAGLNSITTNFKDLNQFVNQTMPDGMLKTLDGATANQNEYTKLFGGALANAGNAIRAGIQGLDTYAATAFNWVAGDPKNFTFMAQTTRDTANGPQNATYEMTITRNASNQFGDSRIVGLKNIPANTTMNQGIALASKPFNDTNPIMQVNYIENNVGPIAGWESDDIARSIKDIGFGGTMAKLVKGSANSTTNMYATVLRRPTDPGGFDAYRYGVLSTGNDVTGEVSAEKLAQAFNTMVTSEEYQWRVSQGLANPALATGDPNAIAQEVLGRALTVTEQTAWMNAYGSGGVGAVLKLAFSSAEAIATTYTRGTSIKPDSDTYKNLLAQLKTSTPEKAFAWLQGQLTA